MVVASLAFATSSPLARAAVGLSPIAVAAGRTFVASAIILAMMPRRTLDAFRALQPRQRLGLATAGLLLAVHFALFLEGLATTSFPAAVALISLEPLAVILAGWMAFAIRPTVAEAAGVVIATFGALVVSSGAGQGEHRVLGDALVVLAVVFYGAYVSMARGLRRAMPALPYAAWVYGIASASLAPFAAVLSLHVPPPPVSTWVAVVLLGIVPTLVGHTLVQLASRRASPVVVALVSPGETLGSLVIGALLLHAWPTTTESIGAALVLAGASVAIVRSG